MSSRLASAAMLCGVLVVLSTAWGQQIQREQGSESVAYTFGEANQHYANGDYQAAAAVYESLVEQGYHALAVYYNLGNAYLRMENAGRAVLCYRRALLIAPRHRDTLHNLRYAESQLSYQASPIVETWGHLLLRWLLSRLSINELVGFSALLYWLAVGVGIWRMYNPRRKVTVALWALVIALCVCSGLSYGKWHRDYASGRAIVVSDADMMSGPGHSFELLAKLRPGAEVSVLQTQGQYRELRTEAGGRGWMDKQHLEFISPYQ